MKFSEQGVSQRTAATQLSELRAKSWDDGNGCSFDGWRRESGLEEEASEGGRKQAKEGGRRKCFLVCTIRPSHV